MFLLKDHEERLTHRIHGPCTSRVDMLVSENNNGCGGTAFVSRLEFSHERCMSEHKRHLAADVYDFTHDGC
jgi:hypothetical protein